MLKPTVACRLLAFGGQDSGGRSVVLSVDRVMHPSRSSYGGLWLVGSPVPVENFALSILGGNTVTQVSTISPNAGDAG
jgi:hypothetical protein